MFHGFVLAATHSGAGKTTITAGILGALKRRGLSVQAYKTGPDYIDPAFHSFITEKPAYNLDSFLLDDDTIQYLYRRHAQEADVTVIEGVMGLFDGVGGTEDKGSTAYLAKCLNLPVILIIDGSGQARSAGALVKGFAEFDKNLNISGVIVNKVSTKNHYEILKTAIESATGIPCIGYVTKNQNVQLTSRHLGLVPAGEVENLTLKLSEVVDMIESCIDIDALLEKSNIEKPAAVPSPIGVFKDQFKGVKVAVARDRSFSFYYEDNLQLMKDMGAELTYFSPMTDQAVPQADFLYIGGGFPEVFGKALSENDDMKRSIKHFADSGKPIYAECGGLMYLCQAIVDLEGQRHQMVGLIAGDAVMTGKLRHFGYNHIEVSQDLAEPKILMRGHEFHRSEIVLLEPQKSDFGYTLHKVRDGVKGEPWQCGYRYKNTFGAYAHIHFYTEPKWLSHWLTLAKNQKELRHESI